MRNPRIGVLATTTYFHIEGVSAARSFDIVRALEIRATRRRPYRRIRIDVAFYRGRGAGGPPGGLSFKRPIPNLLPIVANSAPQHAFRANCIVLPMTSGDRPRRAA